MVVTSLYHAHPSSSLPKHFKRPILEACAHSKYRTGQIFSGVMHGLWPPQGMYFPNLATPCYHSCGLVLTLSLQFCPQNILPCTPMSIYSCPGN